MNKPTNAGDAYDAELLAVLRDAFDRADPVPEHVMAAASKTGALIQDPQPTTGQEDQT